jgi:hypothetical protein
MKTRFQYFSMFTTLTLATLLASLTACKQNSGPTETAQPSAQQNPTISTSPALTGGSLSSAGGIAWTVPAAWGPGPQHQMRIATYHVRAIAGDPDEGECGVYFFGTGQGGTVDANLDRWAGQFTGPNGQPLAEPAKMEKRVIAGLKVSTLTVSGTYMGAGGMMGQAPTPKPNCRMRAAIIEAPQGLVFFKLTGPLNTVAAAESDFNSLLGSVHPQ